MVTGSDFEGAERHYDEIAQQWVGAKTIPYIEYILTPSLFNMICAVEGKKILDLACGEGADSRRLKKLGAADVLGVDISHEMIRLAEQAERDEPLGCRYLVANVAELEFEERFDLVVGAFLLNHALPARIISCHCFLPLPARSSRVDALSGSTSTWR